MQPGCYGAPSVFSFSSRVCGKCGHFDDCQSTVHAALKSAPVYLVSKMLHEHDAHCRMKGGVAPDGATLTTTLPAPARRCKKPVRLQLDQFQLDQLAALPKKVGDYLKKLMVRGIDKEVLEAAGKGKNAFTLDKHRPYALALDMLFEGGLTKPMLRTAYCERLGWSEVAAFPQVSMIWHLFPAMGLAKEQGCALIASPNVRTRNMGGAL